MPDDIKTPSDVSRTASLARIADALGLPVSHFYAGEDREKIIYHAKLDDTAVITLVRVYLQAIDPAARRHFMDQVQVFVDELST